VDFIVENQSVFRLGIFAGVLVLMMAAEALLPRRKRTLPRLRRWSTNLALVVVNTLAARLLGPLVAGTVAIFAAERGIGLLNMVELPQALGVLFAVIALDMAIYWQHVASHYVPLFWRFHKVHHADRDIDATTGVRFHPAEIVFSMLYKAVCVLVLGPSLVAVILFEVVLNASAMFNHANFKLPIWLDSLIRTLFVTPDMHRVHHSEIVRETNSNFGFCLSVWDRLFRSYRAQPEHGHDGMVIGLSEHQTAAPGKLTWSLAIPFSSGRRTTSSKTKAAE
jgi:sterol desaturase/sphingolipid hydroxylase (fatty acid hydroxylase superfamily)